MSTTLNLNTLRDKLFGHSLSQQQIDALNTLTNMFDVNVITNNHFKAYMLATVFHECGNQMVPVEEIGRGIGKAYGTTYYGRGYVQLTWVYNYKRLSPIAGVDLVKTPNYALLPKYAGPIFIKGMTQGLFTGKKLSDYFCVPTPDPVNARRIINGTQDAQLIANNYQVFLESLGDTNV